jgi:hypothetical protein
VVPWAQKKSEVKAAKAAKQQPTTTNIGSSRGQDVKRTVHSKLRIVSGRVRVPAPPCSIPSFCPSLPSLPVGGQGGAYLSKERAQETGCGGASDPI